MIYMLMIGSHALQHWFPEARKPLDRDFIIRQTYANYLLPNLEDEGDVIFLPNGGFYTNFENEGIFEYSIANALHDEMLDKIFKNKDFIITDDYYHVPKPEILLSLKLTHRFRKGSKHFLKTMQDIHFLRSKGVKPASVEKYGDLFKRIEKHTLDYGKPSLDATKQEFFRGGDQEKYGHNWEHDSLHEAVKLLDVPAYEYYKADVADVMCDKSKWDACDAKIKLAGAYEESAVLALERCLIPNNFEIEPSRAFFMALEKVCTSITSGWFREFCWENFMPIMKLAEDIGHERIVQVFHDGVESGIVKQRNY